MVRRDVVQVEIMAEFRRLPAVDMALAIHPVVDPVLVVLRLLVVQERTEPVPTPRRSPYQRK